MLNKTPYKGGRTCRVTFALPAELEAERIHVCGEFNDWDRSSHPLQKRAKGHYSTSLTLKTGRTYRFRYLIDGERWENEPQADGTTPNPYGSEDSVLRL